MTETTLPNRPGSRRRNLGYALIVLIVAQALCAAFFLDDIIGDIAELKKGEPLGMHLTMELLANVALIAGIVVGARFLVQMKRRQIHDAERLALASGALHELLLGWFDDWGLTSSEAEVAMFTLKGLSIAEIAKLRGSAEGTVKAHLNAIYRKAGVTGRLQLQGLVVEELMAAPLMPAERGTDSGGMAAPRATPAQSI